MASSKLVCHIDEHFCECAICLKPFLEPKLLPCLHRFCEKCLRPLFANLSEGDIFCCPVCREELAIPEGGLEALKYDFLVCELTKVIQWQKSVQNENQVRRCEGCTKEEESAGLCSKCGGFLCQNCFSFHQTFSTSMLKDHPPVIELKDVMSGKVKISMDTLSQFNAAPRCQNHPENILRLSCVTCKGRQICIACTYEDHVEHRAEAVRIVAGMQRNDLQKKLGELKLLITNWESNYQMLTTIKEKLTSAVEEVTERVRSITETKLEKLKEDRENDLLSTEKKINELRENGVLEKARLENEKNEKIREVERQYDELL
ncbi:E3 ubiquitin-protein ligase TRIM56 [Holothuria leucospilota]|uniref:E3 ubiquitin-protein ligase TRIM56 n=1 Tax=Holothuria leucospilota TaxID=206669 RepID=A0A9Q0YQW7_HOLLE|nr:E3 ubiquitin-protein ligase TRIM56 [Holothuria leucospilota]